MKKILAKLLAVIVKGLKKAEFWFFVLFTLMAIAIWFGGPQVTVANKAIWDSVLSRMLTVTGIGFMGLSVIFIARHFNINKQKTHDELVQKKQIKKNKQTINDELALLKDRIKDAHKTIKKSTLHGKNGSNIKYKLPWYLVLGAKDSGKTSLLEYSGMDFPLNQSLSKRLFNTITSTDYCDWYFSNEAVWLDISGRFIYQSKFALEEPIWNGFFKQLQKKRRQQPINGLLITLSCEQLLDFSDEKRNTHAKEIRERVEDIRRLLKVNVPVYLILTQADKLDGFTETFDGLSAEEREQIFGITFKDEQNSTCEKNIRSEYESLLTVIANQVIRRVHMERNIDLRAVIVQFPEVLASLTEPMISFINHAFSGNRYHKGSYLRGVYFTSAEHTTHEANDAKLSKEASEPHIANPARYDLIRSPHNGLFIRRLLEEMIVLESGIAGIESRYIARIKRNNRLIYLTAICSVLAAGGLWSRAFISQTTQLQILLNAFDHYQESAMVLSPVDDAARILPVLDTLYNAVTSYDNQHDAFIYQNLGLNKMNVAEPAVIARYTKELQTLLLPRVLLQLEEQIMANKDNRDFLFQALRAYLMLKEQRYLDKDYLKNWLALDWSYRYSGNNNVQKALNEHFSRLLDSGFLPPSLSDKVIKDARLVLQKISSTQLIYQSIKQDSFGIHLPDFRISSVLSPQYRIFTHDDYAIPGLYTQKGYLSVFLPQGLKTVKAEIRENWVLGTSSNLSEIDIKKVYSEVVDLYFKDYMAYWTQAIDKLAIAPTKNLEEAAVQLSGLTSGAEPIVRILTAIRRNTTFLDQSTLIKKAGEKNGLLPKSNSKLAKIAAGGMSLAIKQMEDDASARKAIAQRFNTLNLLLPDGEEPVTSLQNVSNAINRMQSKLSTIVNSVVRSQDGYEFARAHMKSQNTEMKALVEAAKQLPEPVRRWVISLTDNIWRLSLKEAHNFINQQYAKTVWPKYKQNIMDCYPFIGSSKDVALIDFNRFFRKNGVLENFWEQWLSPFASMSTTSITPYRKSGRSLVFSDTLKQALLQGKQIRQAFFDEDAKRVAINFQLEPYELGNNLLAANLQIGSEWLSYEHGPIKEQNFIWPLSTSSQTTGLIIEDLTNERQKLMQFKGPWSLFRLFDQFQMIPVRGSRVLKMQLPRPTSVKLSYELTASSSVNPFTKNLLKDFRLPPRL